MPTSRLSDSDKPTHAVGPSGVSSHSSVLHAGGTRTSILTPGVEYTPQELQPHTMDAILEDASLVYFDGRLTDCAVLLAKAARQKGVPVLVEAERPREGLDELLQQADYLCTSTHFPKVHQCH